MLRFPAQSGRRAASAAGQALVFGAIFAYTVWDVNPGLILAVLAAAVWTAVTIVPLFRVRRSGSRQG